MTNPLLEAIEELDNTPPATQPKQAEEPSTRPAEKRSTGESFGVSSLRIGTALSTGAINLLGAPVDFVNWGLGKLSGGYLRSEAPLGGSKSIAKGFNAAGFTDQATLRKQLGGESKSGVVRGLVTAGEIAGGSVAPVAGLYGLGTKVLRTGWGLQSGRASTRVLATLAAETAKRPGIALAGEAGAAIGGGAAREAAEEVAPDNQAAALGAELVGGILGGVALGGAVSRFSRTLPATGTTSQGDNIVAWTEGPDGVRSPVLGADETTLASSKADEVALKGPDPQNPGKEIEIGSVTKEDLKGLQDDVKAFTARQAGEGNRAVGITWAKQREAAERVGEFRIGNLGDSDDARSLLSALVKKMPSKVAKRSDEELMTTASKAAGDMGEDPEAILATASDLAGQLADADTAMAALRSVWTRGSQEINDLYLAGIDWDTASESMLLHAGEAISNMTVLSQMVQKAKAGLGRGLRVNSLPDPDTYLSTLAKNLRDPDNADVGFRPREIDTLPQDKDGIKDWLELWGATNGDRKRQAALLEGLLTIPTGSKFLRQSFANFFTASILSAPRTVALNIVGPGAVSLIRQVERLTGAAVNSINPLISESQRASARAVAKATPKAYFQTFGHIQDAFRQALSAAERNHTIIGGGSQTMDALATYGPFTDNLLEAAGRKPDSYYYLGNLINVWPRAFARLNNGLDEFAKRLAYLGEVRVNAMVEASERGLSEVDANGYVTEAMKSSFDEVGQAADRELLRSAERTTLTAQVGEEGSAIRAFGNYIQRTRDAVPELRYIIPIFNVPANALGETLRRLPIARVPGLNKVMFERTAKELTGELGPVAQADAQGRTILGAAFLMAGYMMNQAGTMTGAGPQDRVDRKVWLQTHQPYSLKVGDEWVRYDKFDILGGLLSIPGTIFDSTIYNPDDEEAQEVVFAAVGALAQWFKDRAALRNATSLLALGDDPTKKSSTVFTQTTGQIISGFFPAAARTLITDQTSPYVPMKRSWEAYLKASVPVLADQVEPMRNVLGEPIQKPINTIGEALLPVSLVQARGDGEDLVLTALDDLYQKTGYGAGADSSSLSYGHFQPHEVMLENGKSLYCNFMQARQTMKLDGYTLRESLEELFQSDEYADAVDGDSSNRLTSQDDVSRGALVRDIFTDYNKAIKAELADGSKIANDYMVAAAAKRRDDAYLRQFSVEELVENPRLFETKGVDRDAYEDDLVEGATGELLEVFR